MWVSRACVVRAIAPVNNWSDAAISFGPDAEAGARTARAGSAHLRVSPQRFAAAVERVIDAMPRQRDSRQRSPIRRHGSLSHAIEWMWCEVAQGSLDAPDSPSGVGQPRPHDNWKRPAAFFAPNSRYLHVTCYARTCCGEARLTPAASSCSFHAGFSHFRVHFEATRVFDSWRSVNGN